MSLLFIFVFLLCIAFGFFYWTRYFFQYCVLSLFAVIDIFIFQFVIFLQSFFSRLSLFVWTLFFFNFYFPLIFFSVVCIFVCSWGVSCVVDEVTIERRTHALSHLFKLSLVSVGVATGSIVVGVLVLVYSSGASFPIITGAPVWSGTVVMLSRLCNAYLSLSFWTAYIFHYKLWIVINCSIL